MAALRQLSTATRCLNCHYHALNSFLAFAGLDIRRETVTSRFSARGGPRHYSHSQLLRTDAIAPVQQHGDVESGETTGNTYEGFEKLQDEGEASIPWYLREQEAPKVSSPPSEREKLPELPDDSPKNLQTILEHLSTDIGLDYLTLLDMRKLDPPPPLGANLIMLIGTARSEKHLHVAADRFSRWLRKTYKLKVEADGLLGRAELKKRLRRKVRKAKLLSKALSPRKSNEDDGVSTAWICVNAGYLVKRTVQERSLESEGIVGFGSKIEGTRLVVQMFTEDKREQMDLETLWNSYMTRQVRREITAAQEDSEPSNEDSTQTKNVGIAGNGIPGSVANGSLSGKPSLHAQPAIGIGQVRGFHSIASCRSNDIEQGVEPATTLKQRWGRETNLQSNNVRAFELLYRLKSLSPEIIRNELGTGSDHRASTAFLREFYGLLPKKRTSFRHWKLHLDLVFLAFEVGHPGYDADSIVKLLEQCPKHDGFLINFAIGPAVKYIFHWVFLSDSDKPLYATVFRLVDFFSKAKQQNADYYLPAICEDFYLMTIRAKLADKQRFLNESQAKRLVLELSRKLHEDGAHPRDPQIHARILEALAFVGEWTEYWRYWRGIARRMERRPQFLYSLMFQHIATTGHARKCIRALEEWVPEIEIEEPPVLLSADLARSIMHCTQVADPDVLLQVAQNTNQSGQWVKLWRRCEAHLEAPPERGVGIPSDLDRVRNLFADYQEDLEASMNEGSKSGGTKSPEEVLDDL